MNIRTLYRLAFFGLIVLILASILTAVAAANTVPSSYLADQTRAIDPLADLKPPECQALSLSVLTICPAGGGTCSGSGGNTADLILGSAANDVIEAGNGNDCLVGGAGTNTLDGGPGNGDVCIGNLEDTYSRCETIIYR